MPPDTVVEVKCAGGDEDWGGIAEAETWTWKHFKRFPDANIIAYRIIKPSETKTFWAVFWRDDIGRLRHTIHGHNAVADYPGAISVPVEVDLGRLK